MRWRPWMWLSLSMLCFLAAVYFWHLGDEWAAQKAASPNSNGTNQVHPPADTPKPGPRANAAPLNPPLQLLSASGHVNSLPVKNQQARSTNEVSRTAYRLTNTAKPLSALAHSDTAILLENALIDTGEGETLAIPESLRSTGDPGSYIVQSRGPLDDHFRALLKSAGAQVVSYIPNNAYLVRASQASAQQLQADIQTQAVLPYEPYYKLKPSLLSFAVQQQSLPDQTLLNLLLFSDARDAALDNLQRLGVDILAESHSPFGPVLQVKPPVDSLAAIAALPAVQVIEPVRARRLANDLSRVALGVAQDTTTTTNYLDLKGSGVLVAMADTGIDASHPDLSGRVRFDIAANSLDTNGHGTHVAGIIAGDGSKSTTVTNAIGSINPGVDKQYRGKAPAASLFSMNINQSDVYLQQTASRTGALISNNSWTYDVPDYDLAAASYDAAVRDSVPENTGSQALIYVFPSGNEGAANSTAPSSGSDGGSGGLPDTVQSPGTAKNVITVGAVEQFRSITNQTVLCDPIFGCITNQPWFPTTDSSNQVAGFSGRGNVGIGIEGVFGRFKPDVVASGTFVVSDRSAQWDQGAYYNATNFSIDSAQQLPLAPFSSYTSIIFVPNNAVQLIVTATALTPLVPLPISVTGGGAAVTGINQVAIPPSGSLTPSDTFWTFTITNSNPETVTFNWQTILVTTNEQGDFFTVLKDMNDSLGGFYRYESGTSLAAGEVSGVLALMEEFFAVRSRVTNSPAMMKALLINGARSLGQPYDFQVRNTINYQGWGQVSLPTALPGVLSNATSIVGDSSSIFLFDQDPNKPLASGQSHTRFFSVSPEGQNQALRVTLAWTDPPGNPAASIKLVNDLDLVVTNLDTGEVFLGNDIQAGSEFNIAWDTNRVQLIDVVNNVENVYLKQPLATNYSVTVLGHRVNVNAVTANPNDVVQDYALVVSSGDGVLPNTLTWKTDAPTFSFKDPNVTVVTNMFPNDPENPVSGGLLLHQRAGANTPLLGTNTVPYINGANGLITTGMTNQWHFYVLSNQFNFTNVSFVTFMPPEEAVPRMGVTNVDNPNNASRVEADIDMYASTDPGLTNLSPTAVEGAFKSLNRGGTEVIVRNDAAPGSVYYVGIKSEDQQAAEYSFLGVFSLLPPTSSDSEGNVYLRGVPVPAVIPPGIPPRPQAALVLGIDVKSIQVRRVIVTNTFTHSLPGSLLGNLSHNTKFVVLNNHTCALDPTGNCYTNRHDYIYEDNGEHNIAGSRPSDGPGNLKDFIGEEGLGVWLLSMVNTFPAGTGEVDRLTIKLEPQQINTNGTAVDLLPNSWFYDSIDVPGDATNLTVCVTGNTAPLDLYISRSAPPTQTTFDFHLRVNPPGGCLPVTVFDVPPLSAGRYYVGVFNNTFITQHIRVTASIFRNPFAIASSISGNGTTVSIKDDSVTYAFLTNRNDLPISSLDVGLLLRDPRVSDLAITLISPKGTRVLLFENRGAASTSGLGTFNSPTTNSSGEPIFTSTSLVPFYTNDFDRVITGPYAPGTIFDGWTVLKDHVNIYPEMPAPWLSNNVAILTSGIISNNLPTTNSTSYVLSFEAAHAPFLVGTVGWWPMDGDASDIFGGFNGLLLGNVAFTPIGKVNQAFVGDGLATRMIVPRAPRLDLAQGEGFSIEGWVSAGNLPGAGGGTGIVLDDGFELATPAFQVPAGSTVSGWHVDTGQIDVLSSQFPSLFANPDSGIKCVDLNGFVPGSISRSFPTTAGKRYVVNFAYTKNPTTGDPNFVADATISLTGQPDAPFSYGLPNTINNPGWIHTSIVFTATSPTTKLTFTSTTPGKSGMWLDTVLVRQTNSTTLTTLPLVEWNDPSSSAPQGVQFFISPLGSTNGLSFLAANLWDANQQPHIVSTPTSTVTNADWQHVALTFDRASSFARLYVNGTLLAAQGLTNVVPRTVGDVYFGYHPSSGPDFLGFSGALDEFALYDRSLTDCEIAAIFNAGSSGKYSTNALGCPVGGTVQLLTSLGPISLPFTNGPTWGTNLIAFTTPPPVAATNGLNPSYTPITVTSFDPNLAVDHFVLSSIMTNAIDGLMHLTDNTNLASIPIKFAPAPYAVSNFQPTLVFSNEFENAAAGLYAPGSILPGGLNSPAVGPRPWTVVNGPVTVVSNDLVAAVGSKSVALGSGAVQCALPTTPGRRYRLTYSVRGPGMVGWWNGDVEPLSRRAWDLIGGNHGAFIDGATNSSAGFVNFRQDTQALSFPGVIDPQNNLVSKIEIGDPVNLRLTNSFTIEGWIKPSPVADFIPEQTEQIFFRGDSRQCFDPYYLGVERVTADTMDIVFHVEDDQVGDCGVILETANQPVRVGQWQHIAAVFEANVLWQTNAPWPTNELRLYVNGKQLTIQNNEVFLEAPSGLTIINTSFTDRFPFGDLDPSFSPGVAIGNRSRGENSEPYHGLIDELSVYGRALTGPEIAAIAAAGINGKADPGLPPSLGLAKVAVLANNLQLDAGWGDNSDWTAHSVDFTADRTNLVLTLQSLLPGTIVDGVSLTELPSELNYLPEESLAKLNGEDAAGLWTLEIVDNRVGANVPIDPATLLDWQLNFVLQPSNPPPVVHLQHGIVYTNTLAAGAIQNLVVDVPLWASSATNQLLTATDRTLANPLPVAVLWDLFDQSPNAVGQAIVWPPNPTGGKVLFTTAAPNIVPGQPYYVAITNPNPVAATFAYGVWFDVPTLADCVPSSNFVAKAGVPRYFQFDVPTSALPAASLQTVSFYLTGVPNNFVGVNSNVTVVLSEHLPLPDLSQHDYSSSRPNTNNDIIMLVTNTTPFPIQTNRWYVGIFNQANTPVPLTVQACSGAVYPAIVPLTNNVPFVAGLTNPFVAPPGPPRQFFFQFQVTNEVSSILFEMYNLSGNVDLLVQRDLPPTMAPYYGESFRPGTNWEQVVARVSPEVPSLLGNWYVGIYNNETANVAYSLRAVEVSSNGILQSIQEPPVPTVQVSPTGQGVLLSWYSIIGEYYQVQFSAPNPVNFQPLPGGLIHATTPLTTFLVSTPGASLNLYKIEHISPFNLPMAPLQIQLWTNNQVRISWSSTYPNGILQFANSPLGPWFDANLPAVLVNGQYVAFDSIRQAPRYYRLLQ